MWKKRKTFLKNWTFHLSINHSEEEKKKTNAMAVLLTYHKLVERDAKNIDVQWKGENIEYNLWGWINSSSFNSNVNHSPGVWGHLFLRCVLEPRQTYLRLWTALHSRCRRTISKHERICADYCLWNFTISRQNRPTGDFRSTGIKSYNNDEEICDTLRFLQRVVCKDIARRLSDTVIPYRAGAEAR